MTFAPEPAELDAVEFWLRGLGLPVGILTVAGILPLVLRGDVEQIGDALELVLAAIGNDGARHGAGDTFHAGQRVLVGALDVHAILAAALTLFSVEATVSISAQDRHPYRHSDYSGKRIVLAIASSGQNPF